MRGPISNNFHRTLCNRENAILPRSTLSLHTRTFTPFHRGRTLSHHFTPRCAAPGNNNTSPSSPSPRPPPSLPITSAATLPEIGDDSDAVPTWCWTGADDFTRLNDRQDLPPLPLPTLLGRKIRVVLVRHGQSTWNARGRIQGSSDFSVLTERGVEQAEAAGKLLSGWEFDRMFASPLKRAAKTAQLVWGPRTGPVTTLPSLREVDLYSFQGLDKSSGRSTYPTAYDLWQQKPAEFIIDGRRPVPELWYRASLAWRDVLRASADATLVVAHNAVNQAMICTALGLGPSYFRRLTQNNASFTVVEFEWGEGSGKGKQQGGKKEKVAPKVTIERMNCAPDDAAAALSFSGDNSNSKMGRPGADRLILVSGTAGSPQVTAALRFLADGRTAAGGLNYDLSTSPASSPPPLVAVGASEAQAADIATAVQATLGTPRSGGRQVLAVAAPEACQLVLEGAIGAPGVGPAFQMSEGGITVVNYPRWQAGKAGPPQGNIWTSNFRPGEI